MKALTLIPKKVKETYHILRRKDCIEVHFPVYVNIDFNERFEIIKNEYEIRIRNNQCAVSLCLYKTYVHITIF